MFHLPPSAAQLVMSARNADQAETLRVSDGPVGFLESRMCMAWGQVATSRQSPPWLPLWLDLYQL
uniref:Uncharacterized protein n=1 Tax=Streptomyces auratus AGR0001 TaxID=1160718 RepID=J1SAD5_9ACTN